MDQELFLTILKTIGIPALFVIVFIPLVKILATHIGALDIPNERKVHKKPIPRLGGLGIYFGFLIGYMLFGEETSLMNSILIGSFVIILIGVVDDIKPLKASYKLLAQTLAALIVVFYGGILFDDINIFGLYFNFGYFAYPITIFFILGCINCMNFIDGIDGLASGVAGIFFLTIGIIAVSIGDFTLTFTLTFIMLGTCLGFLVHNFNPATIFMGDSGSMFLGFIISIITLLGYKTVMMETLLIPLLILAVPILDTAFAIIRRKLKGESISKPDKMHIHHQFLKMNFSQKATVIIIYLITAAFATASIIHVTVDASIGYTIYGILLFLLIMFAIRTDWIKSNRDDPIEQKKKRTE